MALHLDSEREWTYEEYLELPDDGKRYEIIDGRLYVTPARSPYHQILSGRLLVLFHPLQEAGQGMMIHAPVDLLMPGATPVQPDLVYLRPDQASMVTRRALEGVPELLIEILSPSTAGRDRTLKMNKYANCGVPRYWLVDPFARTLEVYALKDGKYQPQRSLNEQDEAECFPGVTVDMKALFAGIPPIED